MHTSSHISCLFEVGVPLMIFAFILQIVTLKSQDYRAILRAYYPGTSVGLLGS